MIYTVTFNPSLDYYITVLNFQTGNANQAEKDIIVPGGKGINVSIVLGELGVDSCALGFISGFTGAELKRLMEKRGCKIDLINLDQGNTRINVKIKDNSDSNNLVESDINGVGPEISMEALQILNKKLEQLQPDDVLVLAGSIPRTLPSDLYKQIVCKMNETGIKIVVDASGDLLEKVIPCEPFLIKPNHHELGGLFGITIDTTEKAVIYAKKLCRKGAQNVLVSMAGSGAVLVTENEKVYYCGVPKGDAVNTIGAGDSMVAGFLAGFLETGNYEEALKKSVAAGSASAFSEWLPSCEDIRLAYSRLPAIIF